MAIHVEASSLQNPSKTLRESCQVQVQRIDRTILKRAVASRREKKKHRQLLGEKRDESTEKILWCHKYTLDFFVSSVDDFLRMVYHGIPWYTIHHEIHQQLRGNMVDMSSFSNHLKVYYGILRA